MELEDYNCWTIAEAAGHCRPHRLQHLLSRAAWDDEQVLERAAAWAAGSCAGHPLPEHGVRARGPRHYDWAILEITADDTPEGQDDGHSVLLIRWHRYTRTLSFYRVLDS